MKLTWICMMITGITIMSKTEYVLVPKRLLEQLEEDRQALYQIAEENDYKVHIVDDVLRYNLTGAMWRLGNTKFKPYNGG